MKLKSKYKNWSKIYLKSSSAQLRAFYPRINEWSMSSYDIHHGESHDWCIIFIIVFLSVSDYRVYVCLPKTLSTQRSSNLCNVEICRKMLTDVYWSYQSSIRHLTLSALTLNACNQTTHGKFTFAVTSALSYPANTDIPNEYRNCSYPARQLF